MIPQQECSWFREALPSVLEPLQSASDVFLGWTLDEEGRSYYFRQLRDMK
jgi:Uncharacterized protein conserved in bacteria (DUF2252)